MEKLPNIQKIAVLRATGLGDFLVSTPALRALRETYPDAEIVYLGKPWHKPFLESRPSPVDRVAVVPIAHGIREEMFQPHLREDPAELEAFFADMQQEKFDLGIQMHGGGRNSNPFVLRLGAPYNIGMRTPDAPAMDRWTRYLFYQHEIMRLLELVRLVGAQTCDIQPSIALTENDTAEVDRQFPDLPTPFVVLHPGAGDMRRRWPSENFATTADALAERGYQIVVSGSNPDEEGGVRSVISTMHYPAINAYGCLSIGGLAALMARAALVVTNDSGPLHVANAVGTPNVAIYWGGNFMNWTYFGRSKHRPFASWTTHCPLCGVDLMLLEPPDTGCKHETSMVTGVTVEEVLEAAFDLLAYPF